MVTFFDVFQSYMLIDVTQVCFQNMKDNIRYFVGFLSQEVIASSCKMMKILHDLYLGDYWHCSMVASRRFHILENFFEC